MAFSSPHIRLSLVLVLVSACGLRDRATSSKAPPPYAEFLVATQDSTFWITTKGASVRARGAPLTLAQYDNRFFEIYLADDDRSYEDALLLGLRVYRRDLVAGDSEVVFEDSIVPRIAREYALAHPRAHRLATDEDGPEDPSTQALADLEVIDVHGPYLSYEYHVDVSTRGAVPWHATRRGVIDLRSGRAVRVSDLFPAAIATALIDSGKRELGAAIDSLRAERTESARRVMSTLARNHFDDRSFVLTVPDSDLAIEFDIPQRGPDVPDEVLPLDALHPPAPGWWRAVANDFPRAADDLDRWPRFGDSGYDVLARYDSAAETAHLSLSDHVHEWPVRAVVAPVLHVFWLDRPALDDAQRRALDRAFDAASQYDEATRTVRDLTRPPSRPRFTALGATARRVGRNRA